MTFGTLIALFHFHVVIADVANHMYFEVKVACTIFEFTEPPIFTYLEIGVFPYVLFLTVPFFRLLFAIEMQL